MYQQLKIKIKNTLINIRLSFEVESARATKFQKPDEKTHRAFLRLEIAFFPNTACDIPLSVAQ